jgi:3-phytase/alkaline phosphatase D
MRQHVAADIHSTLVNNLTYQVTPFGPQIPSGAFEVTTGALALDAPFGPTIINLAFGLGFNSQAQRDFYFAAPAAVQEQFLTGLINNAIAPLGYDPLRLQGSNIGATLLRGAYTATNSYGWTELSPSPLRSRAKLPALIELLWGPL